MIYSIGYQRLTVPAFIKILKHLQIDELIDVREKPVSRKPGFSRSTLEPALASVCTYTAAGHMLGGRGNVTAEGIAFLKTTAKRRGHNAMLMCMEEVPGDCHRHEDIALGLLPEVDVMHVCVDELFLASELQRATEDGDEYDCEEMIID